MATFNKFQQFVTDLAAGVHANALNASTDTLMCGLSNTAPSASADAVWGDITEISAGNGYTAGGDDTTNVAATSTGTISVSGTDIVVTASGGSVGAFRYVVLYNDTPSSPAKPLIGWWDYGSSITLADGESFTIAFGASIFTIS